MTGYTVLKIAPLMWYMLSYTITKEDHYNTLTNIAKGDEVVSSTAVIGSTDG